MSTRLDSVLGGVDRGQVTDSPCLPAGSSDVEDAKDLLLWAREHGIAFDSLTIGRVELVGTRDLFPHAKAREASAAAEDHEARGQRLPSIYEEMGGDLEGSPYKD